MFVSMLLNKGVRRSLEGVGSISLRSSHLSSDVLWVQILLHVMGASTAINLSGLMSGRSECLYSTYKRMLVRRFHASETDKQLGCGTESGCYSASVTFLQ